MKIVPSLIKNSEIKTKLPVYSGKQIVNGDLRIFSSNRSFLFKNKIIEVSPNHLLLQIESNSFKLSCIRFCKEKKIEMGKISTKQANQNCMQFFTVVSSSCSTWSYSDMATQKMMAVTSSKQWIHFLRSDRWPPTSNNLKRKINRGYIYFLEIRRQLNFTKNLKKLCHNYQLNSTFDIHVGKVSTQRKGLDNLITYSVRNINKTLIFFYQMY